MAASGCPWALPFPDVAQHFLMRWASRWATDKNCDINVQRACEISSGGQLIFWLHDESLIPHLNFLDSLAFASSFLVWLHNLDHFLSTPNSLLVSSVCSNRHFLSSWLFLHNYSSPKFIMNNVFFRPTDLFSVLSSFFLPRLLQLIILQSIPLTPVSRTFLLLRNPSQM